MTAASIVECRRLGSDKNVKTVKVVKLSAVGWLTLGLVVGKVLPTFGLSRRPILFVPSCNWLKCGRIGAGRETIGGSG